MESGEILRLRLRMTKRRSWCVILSEAKDLSQSLSSCKRGRGFISFGAERHMARIPPIDENNPDIASLVDEIRGARGRLINIYRLMLHSPALAEAWFNLNQAARFGTVIDGAVEVYNLAADMGG